MRKGRGSDHESEVPAYRAALLKIRPSLTVVFAISAMLNVLMLTGSIYMLQVYDRVLASGSVPTLVGLFLIVVVLYGFMAAYDALRMRILSRSGLQLDADLGVAGFRALLGRDAKAEGGQTLRDVETLRSFLAGPVVGTLCDLPFVPLYLAVLFFVHPWLGWLTVAGAVIAALLAWASQKMAGSVKADVDERHITDAAGRQAETILAMGMAAALMQRWRGLRDRALAQNQIGQERVELLSATSKSFRLLLQSAILTMGAFLVIQGDMSGGMIIASSVLSGRALGPIDQIIGQWKALARTREAHLRLLASNNLRTSDPVSELDLPSLRGEVRLNNLTLLAPTRAGVEAAKILKDITFALDPGDAVAVLGPSGSGKSTLARLLVGALRPDSGEVRLDGATFDQWDASQLGKWIGYLPQRVEMMPGSIRDNIARFNPTMTDTAVIAAAQQVGIHEMILNLPDGYGTMLGTPGATTILSGGQMQRVGLARALCGKPTLVVLDEPNASLDQLGDAALNAAIASLRRSGSTVVVMTHRPSVLAEVNKLLYLKDGKVALFGPKDEIIARATKGQPTPLAVTPEGLSERAPVTPDQVVTQHPKKAEFRITRTSDPSSNKMPWRIGA